jgi:tetratricopeptide (TPR) repeat protein
MNQSEEEEWKKEQLQTAIEYYKRVIDKIPANLLETKRKINVELAEVLFHTKKFDEAVQIYEDAFNVSICNTTPQISSHQLRINFF